MDDNMSPDRKCERCGASLATGAPEGLCPHCLMALNLATQTHLAELEDGSDGTQAQSQKPQPLPPLEEIARQFPQLEMIECLGRGGMGVVYKARQPRLNRFVAVKLLAREREKNPRFAERFTREAQALAKLNHPNIVTVYDFGETSGQYFLLMEFVDGMSLRQLLQTRKLLPEEALHIVPEICEALQYAHKEGIVHRDIKPENLLLDKHGRIKIADFGIAKLMGTAPPLIPASASASAAPEPSPGPSTGGALTQEQVVGTPHYMAPEQKESPALVDHRADIYSLGVVFYEMLTGELPQGKFTPPSRRAKVDVRLDDVVRHALEKEPSHRYQNASQIKSDIETIARTQASAVPPLPGVSLGNRNNVSSPKPRATGLAWKVAAVLFGSFLLAGLLAICAVIVLFIVPTIRQSKERVRLAEHRITPSEASLTLRGTIKDSVTGNSINGARVQDNAFGSRPNWPSQQCWTDESGRFELRTWKEEHIVTVSAPKYLTRLVNVPSEGVMLPSQRELKLDVQMQPVGSNSTSTAAAEEAIRAQTINLGRQAWMRADYSRAFALLLPEALLGDPVAQHRVGVMYAMGQGVAPDLAEATRWFRKAAEQGQGESQYSVGLRYQMGQSVAADHAEAHRWFKLAANQGIGAAAVALCRQYARGEGVEKDPVEAYKWAVIAARQPDPNSGSSLVIEMQKRLSPSELAEAQKRIREFVPKRTAPADP